jgi:hypothetical protein
MALGRLRRTEELPLGKGGIWGLPIYSQDDFFFNDSFLIARRFPASA